VALLRKPLRVSLVGPGVVGTTLAVLLWKRGHVLRSVVGRHRGGAARCARLVRCRNYSTSLSKIAPDSELLIIATSDKSIRSVSNAIGRLRHIDFEHLVALHTSGALTSDELRALHAKGATTLSFHPLQTFPKGLPLGNQIEAMEGITYGIEGTPRALRFARLLAADLGGGTMVIPKKEKILYHVAGVIASNYIAALLGAVEELLHPMGGATDLSHFRLLVEASVRNAFRLSPRKALTGPIARGSAELVARHLRALRGQPDLRSLYRAVGLYTLELSRNGGKLTKKQVRELRRILSVAG
jgi:predicted short-subunit dehydrogenase-like oxidoreductase (DUF2520 family)